MIKRLAIIGVLAVVGADGVVFAQHVHGDRTGAGAAHGHGGSVTVDMQGEHPEWWSNPYNYAFYGAALVAFANGPDEVDTDALDAAFMQIAGDFAEHMGMDPAMMRDHLKLIPGQMVDIVRDDPTVLDSYDNMILALRGPA